MKIQQTTKKSFLDNINIRSIHNKPQKRFINFFLGNTFAFNCLNIYIKLLRNIKPLILSSIPEEVTVDTKCDLHILQPCVREAASCVLPYCHEPVSSCCCTGEGGRCDWTWSGKGRERYDSCIGFT
jgi:hypothetical protein